MRGVIGKCEQRVRKGICAKTDRWAAMVFGHMLCDSVDIQQMQWSALLAHACGPRTGKRTAAQFPDLVERFNDPTKRSELFRDW
eukprot:5076745-Alexandrium_andersonii.AAC.1